MLNSKYLSSRYLFIVFFTLAFVPTSNVFAQDITSGLTGHWKFDEGTGTTATDSSGSGNTGTLTNGPTWTTGKIGNAVSIGGSSYVSVNSTLDVAALPFSLSLWVNPTNFNDYGTLIGKRTSYSASGMRFNLDLSQGNGSVLLQSASSNLNFTYVPSLNQWTLLTVVVRSGATDLYVNGTLTQTLGAFSLGTGASSQVRMGNAADGPDQYAGSLDDMRVYTRVLSASDISALYSLGSSTTPPPTDTQAPSVPSNLSATAVSASQINLSWTTSMDNVGVTGYRVERCQEIGCSTFSQVGTPSANSYSDTGLAANTAYRYQVRAVDAVPNLSGYSSVASATTQSALPPSQNNMYFNSSEPGCDGSNPNYVMCDDFENGDWYTKDCDQARGSAGGLGQTGVDGWCGNIYANPITPAGAAICGGIGVVGTNCVATSGILPGPSIGGRNEALHGFINDTSYDELYVRWYMKPSSNFAPGHEKMMFFQQNIDGGFQCCVLMFPFGSLEPDFQTQNATTARLGQNLGNALSVIPGHWYYFEVHIKLNTAGGSDGVFDFWMNDCGTNGLGCTGAGTQRARWTNRNDLRDTNPASRIGAIWLENWSNPGSTGEEYYDQMVVSTTRIGPMGSIPPTDTTPPTISMTAPTNGSTVSGTITVSVTASDNIGVSGVQFLLDGINLQSEDTTSPYSITWNTTTAPNGSHTLTARARDAAGNTTTSSSVTVIVDNGPLVGDLNGDRTVNGADWSIMASVWFTADAVADINKDGVVNSIDFSLMNANWGRII